MKVYESDLNFLGKIPVIQQFSGPVRIIYSVFYEKDGSSIGRGLCEIVPVISTISLLIFDFIKNYYILVNILSVFKYDVEIWKRFPSNKHLFNIFENGDFFHNVNKEKNFFYGYIYLNKKFQVALNM